MLMTMPVDECMSLSMRALYWKQSLMPARCSGCCSFGDVMMLGPEP